VKALLVGGAGATGVHIVHGLSARGFDVTVLHRGVHEDEAIAAYRHIHADPHFTNSVESALGTERFALVVLMYGRLQMLAHLFAGRCERLIAIGGYPVYAGFLDPSSARPAGMLPATPEHAPLVDPGLIGNSRYASFARKMLAAERTVLEEHHRGAYVATLFRYPTIYGPRGIMPFEWSVIQRAHDRRQFLLMPDAGLGIHSRCAAVNAAHCVLLSLERPSSHGEIFNVADEQAFSLAQWTEVILDTLGASLELVALPASLSWVAGCLLPLDGAASAHAFADIGKVKSLLGYRDLVPAERAIRQTVEWYLENPIDPANYPGLTDRYDYALEDRVRERLAQLADEFRPLRPVAEYTHAYPHPKQPGEPDRSRS
jgi:nucleoside-diphosphate-sugar epimerase